MPKLYLLDNEASIELITVMKNIHYQLVPLHIHRTNSSESAIKTWKNNFYLV